jgi:hypothetical protein
METTKTTGSVQGFELPRGCLMTTGAILAIVVGVIVVLI